MGRSVVARIEGAPVVNITPQLREWMGTDPDRQIFLFHLLTRHLAEPDWQLLKITRKTMTVLCEDTGTAEPRTEEDVLEKVHSLADIGYLGREQLENGAIWSRQYCADQHYSTRAKAEFAQSEPTFEECRSGKRKMPTSTYKNGHVITGEALDEELARRAAAKAEKKKARAEQRKADEKKARAQQKAAKEAEKAAEKARKAEEKEKAAKRAPAVQSKNSDPILDQMYASSIMPADANAERIYGAGETEAERNVREARHAAKMGRLKDQLEEAKVKTEIAEQQQATRQAKYNKPRRGNRFTDFEQRNTYDFEWLEEKKRRQQSGMNYDEEPDIEQDEELDIEQTQEQGAREFEDFYRAGLEPATSAEHPAMTQ